MAKQNYKLIKDNTTYNVQVSWKFYYKQIQVFVDNKEIFTTASAKDLRDGAKIKFEDGEFELKFIRKKFEISFDGEPLGGSASDPATKIKQGIGMITFLGMLNLIVGLVSLSTELSAFQKLGFGWYNIIVALLYATAWISSSYFNRFLGLLTGFFIFLMDTFFAIMTIIQVNSQSVGSTIVIRLLFGSIIFYGLQAAYKNRKNILEDGNLKYD